VICTLFAFIFAGCVNTIKEGRVYEKGYEPDGTRIVNILVPMKVGKTTITQTIPTVAHHEENWLIRIENTDESGKLQKRTVEVDETTYNRVTIGEWWSE
jgi:hypothetical protein